MLLLSLCRISEKNLVPFDSPVSLFCKENSRTTVRCIGLSPQFNGEICHHSTAFYCSIVSIIFCSYSIDANRLTLQYIYFIFVESGNPREFSEVYNKEPIVIKSYDIEKKSFIFSRITFCF